MNWYKRASKFSAVCYGCGNEIQLNAQELFNNRVDHGNWRCPDCQKNRFAEQPIETRRDRSYAEEYLSRAGRNGVPRNWYYNSIAKTK
jgi:acetyl-CoA carboxylase beta subunit